MLNRSPLNVFEERGNSDRSIGKHERRESKQILDHFARRTVDNFPFGDKRDKSDDEDKHIDDRREIEHGKHTELEEGKDMGIVYNESDTIDKLTQAAKNRKYGEHQRRENRHQHIVAGKRALEDTFEELSAVFAEYLIEALGPTETLIPGLFEGFRLLVVNDRTFAVTDFFALNRHIYRKFDIFGKKVIFPTVVLFNDLAADTESGTRNSTGSTEFHSRVIEIFCFTQEPKRIACGYPVGAVVFGVTVTRQRFISAVEVLVHFLDEVFIDKVIGVEDDICIAIILFGKKLFEKEVERIALTDEFFIISFKNRRTVFSADTCRVVGAVIGDKENLDKLGGIILKLNTFKKITDNVFFVTGRNDNTEFIQLIAFYRFRFIFSEKHPENIQKLIKITNDERCSENYITNKEYLLYIHDETSRRFLKFF